jgi:hypothetical protein
MTGRVSRSMHQKLKVLFLAADPFRDGARRELEEETRAIERAVQQGRAHDVLEFVSHFATRMDDVQDALRRHQPRIVHFVGHGDAPGVIRLGDEQGRPQPVGREGLREMLGDVRDPVRVLVLNGADTLAAVQALSEVADYTIGTNRGAGDGPAVFAQAFYRALATGRTVLAAFELGLSERMMEGSPEAGTPVRRIRRGVNLDATLVPGPDAAAEVAGRGEIGQHGSGGQREGTRRTMRLDAARTRELNLIGWRTGGPPRE